MPQPETQHLHIPVHITTARPPAHTPSYPDLAYKKAELSLRLRFFQPALAVKQIFLDVHPSTTAAHGQPFL